ncbi:uncharacterized protein HaLaN_24776, partial [Haematococcus lacustris]
MRTEIAKSQGRMVVSGETLSSFLSVKGAYVPEKWDVYFTVRRLCYSTLHQVAQPKRVNCLPGSEALTLKKALVATLQGAYGEQAFGLIMPRTYLLPEQLTTWKAWLVEQRPPPYTLWAVKANVHRGV